MTFLFSILFFSVYLLSCFGFFLSFLGNSCVLDFLFFSFKGLDFSLVFVFDFLSLGFFGCVSFITSVVLLYSIFYMGESLNSRSFYFLVFLFVFSMFILVFSGNFITVLIGWDGLGLVSFCLVIYYGSSSSLSSGLLTVFSNRVGDVFFLLSFFFFMESGHFGWDLVSFKDSLLLLVFLFLGAITKSAQFPFSAWLPAAMAAPTPVSSLVHSSTLVTAGVYVLIRFNYLFSSDFFSFTGVFFLLTMLFAGASAFVECDFKKMVAMSTLSQLGMMLFILSVGSWLLSFLHMIIHAFFKSMLFLSVGSMIKYSDGCQDFRYCGGFVGLSSFIYLLTSSMCLCGFSFFLGFYSKDSIISFSSLQSGMILYIFFLIGCVFTVLYSIRILAKTYSGVYSTFSYMNVLENWFFFVPVSFLFMKCWVFGGLFYWFFLSSMNMFLTFFDLSMGLFVLLLGLCLYFFMFFSYKLVFFFSNVSFMNWSSTSGASFLFKNMIIEGFERSWLECLSGGGAFSILNLFSSFAMYFNYLSIGFFFIFFLVLFFLYP